MRICVQALLIYFLMLELFKVAVLPDQNNADLFIATIAKLFLKLHCRGSSERILKDTIWNPDSG